MAECFVILVENCTMEIHPCFFDERPITACKKLFNYLFQEPWRNEESITSIREHLLSRQEWAKAEWDEASATYCRDYRAEKFHPIDDRPAIKATNKKLIAAVKKSKTNMSITPRFWPILMPLKPKQ